MKAIKQVMRYGSVCSGIEAATLAWHSLGWRPAWFSEIEKFPSAVLKYHWPEVPNLGDMTKIAAAIRADEVEAPDILVGGTPCQAFSIAGLRNGLNDARGQLTLSYVELADAIDEKRLQIGEEPSISVWENVPGVLNSNDNAFGCLLAALAGEDEPLQPSGGKWTNAGYVSGPKRTIAWIVKDAQYFGVAQRRRRVFVVASAREDFDPAEVLFELDSMRRDSAPSRETGQEVTGTFGSRTTSGGGFSTDFECAGGLQPVVAALTANGVGTCGADDNQAQAGHLIAGTLLNNGKAAGSATQQDAENGMLIPCVYSSTGAGCWSDGPGTLRAREQESHEHLVTSFNWQAGGNTSATLGADKHITGTLQASQHPAICFSSKDHGSDASIDIAPTLRAGNSDKSHANGGQPPAIAYAFAENGSGELRFQGGTGDFCGTLSTGGGKPGQGTPCILEPYTLAIRGRGDSSSFEFRQDGTANALLTPNGGRAGINVGAVAHGMAVRRLMPIECERLQGMPDNHTRIPVKFYAKRRITSLRPADMWEETEGGWNLMAADGPRYKAIGNSMAVTCMLWLGQRIQQACNSIPEPEPEPEPEPKIEAKMAEVSNVIYQLNVGRCEEVLRGMADNSVDSIVTDPPYGLKFMGNKWDYQVPSVEQWKECLRVLKPGGHLLAFGGSRTYHRLVVNIEDAGFEIRDQLMWIYGSGFPKSKNLTDEHAGKGTALKPAHEPIVMARKPLAGTVEGNVDQYGTGALNIDLCRVPTEEALTGGAGGLLSHVRDEKAPDAEEWKADQLGRWPANVLHDGSEEVVEAFPDAKGQQGDLNTTGKAQPTRVAYGDMNAPREHAMRIETSKSAARFFYCAKVNKSERDEGMERFVPFSASEMTGGRQEDSAGINNPRAGAGRTGGARNNHPTVKPVDLMRYLCRLVTPAGGVVLDPFMGSGSTGKAAMLEGFSFIGIELDPDHLTTAAARISHSFKQVI